ncbi:MAG: GNAT family N-acetyltransferase [Pseudomonadota bacterium]
MKPVAADPKTAAEPSADGRVLRVVGGARDIGEAVWAKLAAGAEAEGDPFADYAFLAALEASGSVGEGSGWEPAFLGLDVDGTLTAAATAYAKTHSQGEYVFDHHWADAYMRAGGRYYPKLTVAAPFTPATGPRLLGATPQDRRALAAGLAGFAEQVGFSSVHVNFLTESDAATLQDVGFLSRLGVQYHWFNRGYADYDAFLATFASRKRKQIKRERREAHASGVTIRRLVGDAIEPRHWDAFWRFYQDTGARKWGTPYLTRAFFDDIARTAGDRMLMVVAERDREPVAGALNFIGADALYGRYWGCSEQARFLHFEVCYHQAIEFAIERGLSRVEAGAQGEHKIARGYEPVATRSAHWIVEPSFREAIARYLDNEREQVRREIDFLAAETPFKKETE